jgi:hypothetical protein
VVLASPYCVCFDFPEASPLLVLHPRQWVSLFPFCVPNRFSCLSDRAPSWFCRWDFFVRALPRRFQLPVFGVADRERRPDLFSAAAFADFAAGQCAPVSWVPTVFFTAVLRSPGGVLPLSLIFSSTVWPKFGLVRSSCSPDCLVRPTGMIFLLLQFSPLERPITVLHLSFSHRSSPIPACCSWFQVSP